MLPEQSRAGKMLCVCPLCIYPVLVTITVAPNKMWHCRASNTCLTGFKSKMLFFLFLQSNVRNSLCRVMYVQSLTLEDLIWGPEASVICDRQFGSQSWYSIQLTHAPSAENGLYIEGCSSDCITFAYSYILDFYWDCVPHNMAVTRRCHF